MAEAAARRFARLRERSHSPPAAQNAMRSTAAASGIGGGEAVAPSPRDNFDRNLRFQLVIPTMIEALGLLSGVMLMYEKFIKRQAEIEDRIEDRIQTNPVAGDVAAAYDRLVR